MTAHPTIHARVTEALRSNGVEPTEAVVGAVLAACYQDTMSPYQEFREFEIGDSSDLASHIFDLVDYFGLPMTANAAIHANRDLICIGDFTEAVTEAVNHSVIDS